MVLRLAVLPLATSARDKLNKENAMTDQELQAEQYKEEYRAECIEMGEHMRQIVSHGGDDVCFNCGMNY